MTVEIKNIKPVKLEKARNTKIDFKEKLQKLEIEKQNIINKRKEEILKLIENIGCLTIDNELIVGGLLLAKEIDTHKHNNHNNKKDHTHLPENLKEIETLMKEKSTKFFRRK